MPRKKTRETFSRYDPAEGLQTEEDVRLYLAAVIEDGDPALLVAALGDIARARNMSQLARDTGLSREGLYKALSGQGNPSLETVTKIAGALGLRLTLEPVRPRDRRVRANAASTGQRTLVSARRN